jgi:CO/xanthine dehydrogenase Mo-binding subunit
MKNTFIGAPIERREDLRFVRGRGTYVDDLAPDRLLHAAILRSSVAHGRIVSIDATAALALPGVHAVITAKDMPGVQKPHCRAWCLWKAACNGVSAVSSERPSTVVTALPSACTASIRHDRTAAPSTITVQAPHTPCSQPTCVPVSRS